MKIIFSILIFTLILYHLFIIQAFASSNSPDVEQQINGNRPEGQTKVIEDIVVTGTMTERNISDSPVLIQILDGRQMREKPILHVGDALEEATGLHVEDESIGGLTGHFKTLTIQGMDRRRVLVLINGNPVLGDYAGRMNLANHGIGAVERIEIVRGPMSSIYGSGAIGGVVNIITKGVSKPLEYSNTLTYRVDAKENGSILWSHRLGMINSKTSLALNFDIETDDGFYIEDENGNSSQSPLLAGYEFNTDFKHRFTTQLLVGTRGQFAIKETQMKRLNSSAFQNFDIHRYFIQPYVQYYLKDIADLKLSFYSAHYDHKNYQTYVEYEDRIKNIEDLESRPFESLKGLIGFEKGEELPGARKQEEELEKLDILANGEINVLLWVAGISASQMKYESDNIMGGQKKRSDQAFFVQSESPLFRRTSLLSGIRYEHSDAYGSDLSPKFSIMHKETGVLANDDSLMLRLSVAKGYRAPDFKELYYDLASSTKGMSIIGAEYLRQIAPWEPRLRPERSVGINIGPEYFLSKRFHTHINLFWNELWDALNFTFIDKTSKTYKKLVELFPLGSASGKVTDPNESEYIRTTTNVERVRTYGVETYLSAKVKGWAGSFSYTYTKARDVKNKKSLKTKPTDILRLGITKIIPFGNSFAITPGISYRYSKGEIGRDGKQVNIYRLDCHALITLGDRSSITLGINNITDQKDVLNLKQLPGRIVYVTSNLNF